MSETKETKEVLAVQFEMLPVAKMRAGPWQARREMKDMDGLVESVRAVGVMCPLTVRLTDDGHGYEIVAGHRRHEAARLAGLEEVPAMVVECTALEAACMCVTENLQRRDLEPLEEAEGVAALLEAHGTASEVAARLGRSPKWVARRALLMKLPEEIKSSMREEPEGPWGSSPLKALEALAMAPGKVQQIMMEEVEQWNDPIRLGRVQNEMERYAKNLNGVCFNTAECVKCLKRTGAQPDMFDWLEQEGLGNCLDMDCFAIKWLAHVRGRIAKLRKRHGEATEVYSWDTIFHVPEAKNWDYDLHFHAEEEPPGTPVIEVERHGEVRVLFVRGMPDGGEASEGEASPGETKQPTALQKRQAKAVDWMREMLDKGEVNPFELCSAVQALNVLAMVGTEWKKEWPEGDRQAWEDAFESDVWGCRERKAAWISVNKVLARRLRYDAIIRIKEAWKEACAMAATLFGVTEEELLEKGGMV